MEFKTRWVSDIEDSEYLQQESSELFFKLAEDRLGSSIEVFDITTSKTNWLIGILLPLGSVCLAYLITNGFNIWGIASLIVISAIIVAMIFLLRNLMTFEVYTLGEEPRFVFTSDFINNKVVKDQYNDLVTNIVELYQYKIDENKVINDKRSNNYRIGMIISLCLPLSIVISYLFCLVF